MDNLAFSYDIIIGLWSHRHGWREPGGNSASIKWGE